MGGSSSRLDSRRAHPKRTWSSYLSCGGGISFICGAPSEIEEDPAQLLVHSAENCVLDKFRTSGKDSAASSSAGSGSTSPASQTRGSASKNVTTRGIPQSRVGSNNATTSSKTGHLFGNTQLFPHRQANRHNFQTSTSSVNIEENGRNTTSKDMCPSQSHHGRSLSQDAETSSDESSNGIQGTALINFSNLWSSSISDLSDSPFSNFPSRQGSGFIDSEAGLVRREDNTVFGDVAEVSASSSLMDNERRNRRLFSDALSRRSRGYHDLRTNFFSTNNSDNLEHHGRWLRNLSSDFLGEGVAGSLRPYENGAQRNSNHQWHSTSEILGLTCPPLDNIAPRTTCLTGIHQRGPCSCDSILRGESSGTSASMSRVVMLAEALFEVLDEVHWQPLSGPLPVVSVPGLPAEESVVNSLPMKNYKKPEESVCSDDISKCYICLDEYEDGDNIRTLPCQHEYHVSCIDKWLKEIHSVCPLCRADVNEGFTNSSIST